jgi:hypothetical protein
MPRVLCQYALQLTVSRGLDIAPWLQHFDSRGAGVVTASNFRRAITSVCLALGVGLPGGALHAPDWSRQALNVHPALCARFLRVLFVSFVLPSSSLHRHYYCHYVDDSNCDSNYLIDAHCISHLRRHCHCLQSCNINDQHCISQLYCHSTSTLLSRLLFPPFWLACVSPRFFTFPILSPRVSSISPRFAPCFGNPVFSFCLQTSA